MTLLALLVLAGFAWYVMKPAERARVLEAAAAFGRRAGGAAVQQAAKPDEFLEAVRTRTRLPIVVPALIIYNVVIFVGMVFGSGALSDPATLVAWGGNFGPRTSNGEWGRLIASMFVHVGPLHLLATVAGLCQAGLLMERLVGYPAFAAVYIAAGFFAGVVNLWMNPLSVGAGASGAVFGVLGFLAAMTLWGLRGPSGISIPLQTAKTFLPGIALFLIYNLFSGALAIQAELAGLIVGFASGALLTRDLAHRKPEPRRLAAAAGATFALAAGIAIPLHGITDVRPEIEWIVRLEEGTAGRYQAAVEQFRKGVISARELAEIIQRNIMPEIDSAQARLSTLAGIPREHKAVVARAVEFLRLRDESWRLRAEALAGGNMGGLREADRLEVSSMQALEELKSGPAATN